MDFELIFILLVLLLTTTSALFLGIRRFGLRGSALREAAAEGIECLGACVVFFGLNAGVGVLGVFLIRATGRFFSLYSVLSLVLLVLSLIQGCIFQLWWRRSHD